MGSSDVFNRARKNIVRSYLSDPTRVQRALRGVTLALDAGWFIRPRDVARINGRYSWVVVVEAPSPGRPSVEIARELKRSGFQRQTNHTWIFPLQDSEAPYER